MASGRELCYVLLVGILSCYGMSFVILSKPTFWNCTYLRIGLGLCLSICYSAILTKTNRISRIFNEGRRMKRPSFTSPKSQVAITIGEFQICHSFQYFCNIIYSFINLFFNPVSITFRQLYTVGTENNAKSLSNDQYNSL